MLLENPVLLTSVTFISFLSPSSGGEEGEQQTEKCTHSSIHRYTVFMYQTEGINIDCSTQECPVTIVFFPNLAG
jgi:hypothetical protein